MGLLELYFKIFLDRFYFKTGWKFLKTETFPSFWLTSPQISTKTFFLHPISKVPFDFFCAKAWVFICKSALLQRVWENVPEATVLCVGQQICIRGTFPTWREDFSSLDLGSTLGTHGVLSLKSVCMFKCERKRLIECHRLGQATLVLVSQYEVRKLHSKAAERCEGWKAAAVPKGNMQLCSTCTCPSVAPRGKSSSTPSFSLLP